MKLKRMSLCLVLAIGLGQPVTAAESAKAASETTKAANAAMLKALPFDDQSTFEDAKRGFIAPLPNNGLVKDAKGNVVWDSSKWDFLGDEPSAAPETVNPSLWRQAQLLKISGLFQVTDEIYQVRGVDISNMTFIEGPDGIIIMDPLMTDETAQAAMDLYFQHRPKKDIVAIIVTHSHIDHFGGLGAATKAAVKDVKIVVPEGWVEASVAENIMGGNLQTRRVGYQYGNLLETGPKGMMTTGLGLVTPTGFTSFRQPTDIITEDGQTLKLGGLTFEFLLALDTEAPAEMLYYIKELRAASMAEDAVFNQHNVYSLRGAKLRDPLVWSKSLKKAAVRWRGKIDSLHAPHHWPVWGAEKVEEHLQVQMDLYKYLHDNSVRLANQGYTYVEAAEAIELPPSIGKHWSARGYYGTTNHNVKAAFVKNFGWYDGNPATLHRQPRKTAGPKYVAAMGGADKVVEVARKAFDEGDYRWAVELLSHVVFSDPENQQARNLAADAHEQLGYQSEAGTWRNWYLSAAKELRDGVKKLPTPNMASPDIIANMNLDLFFDYIGMRLNGPKASGKKMAFNVDFPDVKTKYRLEIRNGVLQYYKDEQEEKPDAALTMNRTVLDDIMLGRTTLDQAVTDGKAKIDGDPDKFAEFVAMLDKFDPWYGMVTP